MALFESYERRIDKINAVLNSYGIASIEEAEKITKDAGLDVYNQIKGIQPICFENACWAYTVGAAIAIKKGCRKQQTQQQQSEKDFRLSVFRDLLLIQRKVGLGHGNLRKDASGRRYRLLRIPWQDMSHSQLLRVLSVSLRKQTKFVKKPLRVILNGLGKDAAQIISVSTDLHMLRQSMTITQEKLKEVFRKSYSDGLRAKVNCYGANDVPEGVAIMWKEGVDVSITGNSTNPTRFQHPVAGTYKKECIEAG